MARKRRRRLPDGTDSFEEVDDDEDTDLDHRVESVETQLSEFFQKSLVSSQQLNAVKARLDKLARDIEEGSEGDDEVFQEIDSLKSELITQKSVIQELTASTELKFNHLKGRLDDVSGLGPLDQLPAQLQEATSAAMSLLESSLEEKIRSQEKSREEETELLMGRMEELTGTVEASLGEYNTSLEQKFAQIEARVDSSVPRDQFEQHLSTFEAKTVDRIRSHEARFGTVESTIQNQNRETIQLRENLTAAVDELANLLDDRASHDDLSKLRAELQGIVAKFGSLDSLDERIRTSIATLQRLESNVSSQKEKLDSLLAASAVSLQVVEEHQSKVNIAVRLVDELSSRAQGPIGATAAPTGLARPLAAPPADLDVPETTEFGFTLRELLDVMVREKATDLYISVGNTPTVRLEDGLFPVGESNLGAEDCRRLILTPLTPDQRQRLLNDRKLDVACTLDNHHLRAICTYQRGSLSACFKSIPPLVSWEELGLPAQFRRLISNRKSGLFLLGSGALNRLSTVVASLTDSLSQSSAMHLVCIERISEHTFSDARSGFVTQLNTQEDFSSTDDALQHAIKLRPDAYLIESIDNPCVLYQAMDLASSGCLVIGGLNCSSISEGLDLVTKKMLGNSSDGKRQEFCSVLGGFLWHRVLPRADKKGTVLCSEWFANSPEITSMIHSGSLVDLPRLIAGLRGDQGRSYAESMEVLVETGLVSGGDSPRKPEPAVAPPAARPTIRSASSSQDDVSDSSMGWL